MIGRLRVLLVHNRYRSAYPSGEDRVVDQEHALLADAGHVVERVGTDSDSIEAMSRLRRAAVPLGVAWSEHGRHLVADAITRFLPDVVHVHNTFPLLSNSVFAACRAADVASVHTVHNYKPMCASGDLLRDGNVCHDCVGRLPLPALRHGCYRSSALATVPVAASISLGRLTWRRWPSAYIALSPAQRALLVAHGADPERVFVKPNFVVAGPHRPNGTAGEHVLSLGRLTVEKGITLLMEAWDRLLAKGDVELPLVIAGSGPQEADVKAWAAARSGSVRFVGLQSRTAAAELVARARTVVLPSLWEETFGLSAVEAMAAGVAPIAPAHGSFPSIITDGIDGLLFTPGDAASLATAVSDALSEPEAMVGIGDEAYRTYVRRFTAEANLEQLEAVYEAALRANRGRS